MSGGVVILSGGLDSTTCMALAERQGHQAGLGPIVALTFDYGQRHRVELERAAVVAAHYRAEHLIVSLDASAWGGSALTDPSIEVPSAGGDGAASPTGDSGAGDGSEAPTAEVNTGAGSGGSASSDPGIAPPAIPVTYVPARNLIFLSVAMAVAEAREASDVWLGVNALDYSGYPDCRPDFVASFETTAALALKRGVEGNPVKILTPLIDLSKAGIVRLGLELGAPLELTWSCYRGGDRPCGDCDSCQLRAKGFAEAGVADPALRFDG